MTIIEITDKTTKRQLVKGLQKLGKGLFTECFALGDSEVLLVSEDPLKEVYSMGWLCDTLFPVTEKVDYLSSGESIYKMKRYTKVSSLKNSLEAEQYEIYKTLRKAQDVLKCPSNIHDSYNAVHEAFSTIEDEQLRNTMIEALDDVANYGSDVMFEISPRNVAVDNGKLILLDCFFMRSTANEMRSK